MNGCIVTEKWINRANEADEPGDTIVCPATLVVCFNKNIMCIVLWGHDTEDYDKCDEASNVEHT